MSDYVDALIAEQGNVNGLLLEILTSGYEEWGYLVAVEGDSDRVFYYDFLNAALPEKRIRILTCGGKPCLVNFKQAVDEYEWISPPNFRYLCDKDFDDYLCLSHPGVWKTHWYSIESYLVQPEYIEYNVAKFASGHLTLSDRKAFIERYSTLFQAMSKAVIPFCAFMCEVRANSEHPQFDDFGIDKLFDVTKRNAPRKVGVLNAAVATLGVQKPVPRSRLFNRAKSFRLEDISKWLRGKLALQIARKSYERAVRETPAKQRCVLPSSNFLGGDALNFAFGFWQSLPGLKDYCAQ